MASIFLIRHAQASFGTDDYDRLSPLGQEQACILGKFLATTTAPIARIVAGPLKRHHSTATEIAEKQSKMHDDGSRVEIDPSLDKLHIDEHVARIAPTLIDLTGEFAADLAAARIESRAYQRVIRRVFIYWQQSEQVCNLETWPDFSARARQSICRIAGQGKRGEITVVVSSGVLIAAITRFVLNLPDSATYGLFEAVKNCSITHLLHSGPRLSLSSFNDTTYLSAIGSGRTGTNLITYR